MIHVDKTRILETDCAKEQRMRAGGRLVSGAKTLLKYTTQGESK